MGDLTKHFSRVEFECKCGRCDTDTVDAELMLVLEQLRMALKRQITVNSGIRCSEHNHDISGSPKSQHLLGKAADIVVASSSPTEVYNYLDMLYPSKYGIGKYKTFVHIDVRQKKARW